MSTAATPALSAPGLTTLSEEEELFRLSVREFAEGEVRPKVEAMEHAGKLDPDLIKQCFELGLMAIETPEEYGGAGSTIFNAIVAIEELARVDASVSVFVDVHNTLVTNAFMCWASETCEKLYEKGYFTRWLENGRLDVRLFENLVYGFYRDYPRRFVPICMIETVYHLVGIAEVWVILYRLESTFPNLLNAFLLESVSRLITVIFKLIPFLIGVDEAGAQFVGQTVALTAGVGVTIAIIRKGRILFLDGYWLDPHHPTGAAHRRDRSGG